jgi:hypothetical protein
MQVDNLHLLKFVLLNGTRLWLPISEHTVINLSKEAMSLNLKEGYLFFVVFHHK